MKVKWLKNKRQHKRDITHLLKSGAVKSFPPKKRFTFGDVTRKSRRRGGNF